MSKQAGCNIWLKLEGMQPTQSFKIRGVGNMCVSALVEHNAQRIVAVGDTNAALAVAYSARQLGVPATIFVPGSGTQVSVIRPKLELEGADVVEEGRTIREAYKAACDFVQGTEGAILIDTADEEAAIVGNATILNEIALQLKNQEPAVIITPVGSGGLLAGIITGLHQNHWYQVPIIAVETHNTNSFQQALLADSERDDRVEEATHSVSGKTRVVTTQAATSQGISATPPPSLLPPLEEEPENGDGELNQGPPGSRASNRSNSEGPSQLHSRVRVSSIDGRSAEPTIATCLSTGSICPKALELSRVHPVVPISVSDAMAAEACRRFLDEHQMLIEVGSAAALSIIGKGLIHQIVPDLDHNSHIVVIVTGGANINFDRIDSYRQRFPYPAPIIAKSGQEVFMRMLDSTQPASSSGVVSTGNPIGATPGQSRQSVTSAVSTPL
ncbi:catabolic L-serine/threonine dehydratase [Coemansia erecta]|uniref:L-serine ammonia-lyase n=1 Tax=Coemansia erecta TaxID=147472 RepID=A0A9W8CRX8_9FUNG|nr:catabolic L-serine/threonine dehydratase [Coemansia erecta]